MQINDILKEICDNNSEYYQILTNITKNNKQVINELISEIAISYLENTEKIQQVYNDGYFKYYFIMTVKNQIYSNTSPYNKNCRIKDLYDVEYFQDELLEDENEIERKELLEERWKITKKVRKKTKVTFFESEMIRLYFDENMTYRAIGEEYGINHTLVFFTIKDVVNRMKKNI